jgi:hypothetical protein
MPLWLSVLLGVCSVLAVAGAAYMTAVSLPVQLRKQITILRAEVAEQAVTCEAFGQRWLAFKTEMEGLAEAVEDNLETTERKRKRAAASAARAKRDNGQQDQPMTPEEHRTALQRHARQAGFEV